MPKKNISPYLSIVIPAYKEIDNLKSGVLGEVKEFLQKQDYTWEVLIVDDGSPDETAGVTKKIIEKWKGFKLLEEPHRGKGGTVIAGVLKAKGGIILFTDMDQATPISELDKILPKFDEGYDVVIGSRQGRKGAPLVRRLMAYGFMVLRALILRLPYKDTQCGFKAFTNKASREIFERMKIFRDSGVAKNQAAVTAGFDLEILYIARKRKLRVSEVPVMWEHKGTARVSPLRDSWQGFRDMIRVRINALMGRYQG